MMFTDRYHCFNYHLQKLDPILKISFAAIKPNVNLYMIIVEYYNKYCNYLQNQKISFHYLPIT